MHASLVVTLLLSQQASERHFVINLVCLSTIAKHGCCHVGQVGHSKYHKSIFGTARVSAKKKAINRRRKAI